MLSSFYLSLREQDEDLDDLSATVERLGDVGLSIHEELAVQVLFSFIKLLDIVHYCNPAAFLSFFWCKYFNANYLV